MLATRRSVTTTGVLEDSETKARQSLEDIEAAQRSLLFEAHRTITRPGDAAALRQASIDSGNAMLGSEAGSLFQAVTHVAPITSHQSGGAMSPALEFQRVRREAYATVFAGMAQTIQQVCFPGVLARPVLDNRTRQLVKIAALTASGRSAEIDGLMPQAIAVGATKETVAEVMLQTAYFAGFPAGANALIAIRNAPSTTAPGEDPAASIPPEEIHRRGLELLNRLHGEHTGRGILEAFGAVCPKMADMTIRTIFGDLLYRPELDLGTREIAIIAALVTLGDHCRPQIIAHAEAALSREVGVTKAQIVEALVQLIGIAKFETVIMAIDAVNSITV